MKFLLALILTLPFTAYARFIFQYGVNYSAEKDDSETEEYDQRRLFHKGFLGATVNTKRTFFFGWNVNSWTSNLKYGQGGTENSYSMLEMGPRFIWFFSDHYNWYFSAEWNPYARGDRDKNEENKEIQGSSYGAGLGYRFKVSRLWGFGAGIHYHNLNLKEEKEGETESNISDKVSNIMPMLELTLITK